MVDKIIGLIIVLAIIAAVIVLLFLGLWLAVFCKTLKTIDKAEHDMHRYYSDYYKRRDT